MESIPLLGCPNHGWRGRRRLGRTVASVLGAAVVVGAGGVGTSASGATVAGGTWQLDETSGTVAVDSSGYRNDGIVRGPVGMGQAGYRGTAFAFGPTNAWVEVRSSTSVNPGTRDFMASAWVKFAKAPPSGVTYDVVRKGLSGTSGGEFKLEIVPGGRAKCIAKDANRVRGAIAGPSYNLADGRWHSVACARAGTAWKVIVDGTVKSRTVRFGSIGNSRSLSIGSQYGKGDPFPGLIDEVQLSIG